MKGLPTPFQMHDTRGVPIAYLAPLLFERGMSVQWDAFAEEALAAGWTREKIEATVDEALIEIAPPDRLPGLRAQMRELLWPTALDSLGGAKEGGK